MPQIEVAFDIDANGIVHVSAKDLATSKEQSMTITGQSSLAKDEINRMVRDAESHAEDDRRRREEAEVRNQSDTLVYQTEKLLREQGDKFEGDEKQKVESALAELKEALSGSDVERIKSATEALMSASHGFTRGSTSRPRSRRHQPAVARAVTARRTTRTRMTRSSTRRSWMSRVRDHAVERLTPQ